jgi:hypothetical protein
VREREREREKERKRERENVSNMSVPIFWQIFLLCVLNL